MGTQAPFNGSSLGRQPSGGRPGGDGLEAARHAAALRGGFLFLIVQDDADTGAVTGARCHTVPDEL